MAPFYYLFDFFIQGLRSTHYTKSRRITFPLSTTKSALLQFAGVPLHECRTHCCGKPEGLFTGWEKNYGGALPQRDAGAA